MKLFEKVWLLLHLSEVHQTLDLEQFMAQIPGCLMGQGIATNLLEKKMRKFLVPELSLQLCKEPLVPMAR